MTTYDDDPGTRRGSDPDGGTGGSGATSASDLDYGAAAGTGTTRSSAYEAGGGIGTTYGASGTTGVTAPGPTAPAPTYTTGGYSAGTTDTTTGGTTQVAKEQAGEVGSFAAQAGAEVAQTAKEQVKEVAGEAARQARDLTGELRSQVSTQASGQRDRLSGTLRSLSDELDTMAERGGQSGVGTELARQVSDRGRQLAEYLERREPSDLIEEVRRYARRRPTAFLVGAAVAGAVAGRLVKGMTAGSSGQRSVDLRGTGAGTPVYSPPGPLTSGGTYGESSFTDPGYAAPTYTAPTYTDPTYSGREAIGVRTPSASTLETGPGGYGSPTSGARFAEEKPGTVLP